MEKRCKMKNTKETHFSKRKSCNSFGWAAHKIFGEKSYRGLGGYRLQQIWAT